MLEYLHGRIVLLRQDWEWHEYYAHTTWRYERNKPPNNTVLFAQWVWETIKYTSLSYICKWRGHNVECTYSWANPESGGETHECMRCGKTWNDIYY